MFMKRWAVLIIAAIVCAPTAQGRSLQSGKAGDPGARLAVDVDYYIVKNHKPTADYPVIRFRFSIAHPEMVRSAWIEVLDRPLLITRLPVPIQPQGELLWDWRDSDLETE